MTVYITGDVHGDALDLAARADAVGAGEGDDVLVLGDVGLMYGHRGDGAPVLSPWMAQLMSHEPWRLVVMRGNHDTRYGRDLLERGPGACTRLGAAAPCTWAGGPAFVCAGLPSIVFLPDTGGLYGIDGVRTLIVPGACSVDKGIRLGNGWPWEPGEQLTGAEMARLLDAARADGGVELVLSHTCPRSWRMWMGDLLGAKADADDAMERWMDVLLEAVRPTLRRWAFGHFHGDRPVGFGLGRLMFRDISEARALVEGDARGTARPDRGYETGAAARSRALHRVLGAAPRSPYGYTDAELTALTGLPAGDIERIMAYQSRTVDPDTGGMLTMECDVPQIVRAAWQ